MYIFFSQIYIHIVRVHGLYTDNQPHATFIISILLGNIYNICSEFEFFFIINFFFNEENVLVPVSRPRPSSHSLG